MRSATAVFSLALLGALSIQGAASADSRVTDVTLYETRDPQVDNDLPCYRLGLGAMLDSDGQLERVGVYRGREFVLRALDPGDCTRWLGEAAYDEQHSFFLELVMDANCRVPKAFRTELKARHDPDGTGLGVAVCKKLRRSRGRR